jgi:hypothetical protein
MPDILHAAAPLEVVARDGTRMQAALVSIDGEGLVFREDSGTERRLDRRELIRWGHPAEALRGAQLHLAGGGLLVGDVLKADPDRIKVFSPLFGDLELDVSSLVGVVQHPPVGPSSRDRWFAPGEPILNRDHLYLENGDVLEGTMISWIEPSPGLSPVVTFKTGDDPREIPVTGVRALRFDPGLVAVPERMENGWRVGFRDGTYFAATTLFEREGQAVIERPGGVSWACQFTQVVWLQPIHDSVLYLSDLEPQSYKHVPYLTRTWPLGRDRSCTGARLRAGGRLYGRGISFHSAAQATYRLDGQWSTLAADLAIDDEADGGGHATLRVYADGREIYQSPPIAGGQPPIPMTMDVAGVGRLTLVVDFGERADELDYVDLLDARLLR